jgi:hypothetical protein
MREFLTIGTQLIPHKEVNGNPWGREVRAMYGLKYEQPGSDTRAKQLEAGTDDLPDA